jgi:hypothetical protein
VVTRVHRPCWMMRVTCEREAGEAVRGSDEGGHDNVPMVLDVGRGDVRARERYIGGLDQ